MNEKDLLYIMRSPFWKDRLEAVCDPHATERVLRMGMIDPNPRVREAAARYAAKN
jgi:hypothetical protein